MRTRIHGRKSSEFGRTVLVGTLSLVFLGLSVGACGGEEEEPEPEPPKPPQFGSPSIECDNPEGDEFDKQVITKVSVRVFDEDRDLLTQEGALCGTLDGLPIALRDDDADRVFTWNPADQEEDNPCDGEIQIGETNRMVCEGEKAFRLKVTARDKAGNTTRLDEVVTKGSSE